MDFIFTKNDFLLVLHFLYFCFIVINKLYALIRKENARNTSSNKNKIVFCLFFFSLSSFMQKIEVAIRLKFDQIQYISIKVSTLSESQRFDIFVVVVEVFADDIFWLLN